MTDQLQMVLDNRVNVSSEYTKLVTISGAQTNYYELTPDGGGFTSNITFNSIVTPSLSSTLVGRQARLRYQVTVAATADPVVELPNAALGAGIAAGQLCLRAFPIQGVTSTASLVINGSTTTVPLRQVLTAVQRKLPADFIKGEATECPCMADQSACLVQDALATAITSQRELSSYYNSDGTTRASFLPMGEAVAHVVTYDVSEPLLISPFSTYADEVALGNINTMSLMLQFSSSLLDMFSTGQAAAPQAGFTVAILNPRLELTYIQVSQDVVQIPRLLTYPYESINYFAKSIGTMPHTNAAFTFANAQSDTIRLQSMPELIYIFARPLISARTSVQTDAMLALGTGGVGAGFVPSLSIAIGNRTGQLIQCSAKTLWKMSRANGSRQTYNDFQYGAGSLLILSPVRDFGLDVSQGDILPTESGSVNFQVSGTWSNMNYVSGTAKAGGADIAGLECELVIAVCYAGQCMITPDSCVYNIGSLSSGEVSAMLATQPKDGTMISSEAVKPTIQAGSLFGRIKSVLGHTARGLQTAASHPFVEKLARGGVISAAGLRQRR